MTEGRRGIGVSIHCSPQPPAKEEDSSRRRREQKKILARPAGTESIMVLPPVFQHDIMELQEKVNPWGSTFLWSKVSRSAAAGAFGRYLA